MVFFYFSWQTTKIININKAELSFIKINNQCLEKLMYRILRAGNGQIHYSWAKIPLPQ